jgi:hypothetical protein
MGGMTALGIMTQFPEVRSVACLMGSGYFSTGEFPFSAAGGDNTGRAGGVRCDCRAVSKMGYRRAISTACQPSAFLWHGEEDDVVPAAETLRLQQALAAARLDEQLTCLWEAGVKHRITPTALIATVRFFTEHLNHILHAHHFNPLILKFFEDFGVGLFAGDHQIDLIGVAEQHTRTLTDFAAVHQNDQFSHHVQHFLFGHRRQHIGFIKTFCRQPFAAGKHPVTGIEAIFTALRAQGDGLRLVVLSAHDDHAFVFLFDKVVGERQVVSDDLYRFTADFAPNRKAVDPQLITTLSPALTSCDAALAIRTFSS